MRLIAWVASGIVLAGMFLGAGPAVAQTTYVFGNQGEPVQLDSAVVVDGISNRTTRQIYEGLVKYKGATTEVVPALAEKWQVSQDVTRSIAACHRHRQHPRAATSLPDQQSSATHG